MNFLKFYIAWILGGDLSLHTEHCGNNKADEIGICTTLWSCVEVMKGSNTGTCGKDISEQICCKIKRFDETNPMPVTTNISNKETKSIPQVIMPRSDIIAENNSSKYLTKSSVEKSSPVPLNIFDYSNVNKSHVMVEKNHNGRSSVSLEDDFDFRSLVTRKESLDVRKLVQITERFGNQNPVNVNESDTMRELVQQAEDFNLRLPVRKEESHDMLKPVQLVEYFDRRSPVKVEESHNMRKPGQMAHDVNLRFPVRVDELHDLRWPVVEEDTHDIRNPPLVHFENALKAQIAIQEEKEKNKDPLESRNFSNYYEYLANQNSFKDSEENNEINKECMNEFLDSKSRNKSFKKTEQVSYNELIRSSSEICGVSFRKTTSRLVGGKDSNYMQWPWMVSLRKRHRERYWHKCGAALLNKRWVITVAHCVEFILPWDLSLRLGSSDLGKEDEPHSYIIRTVDKVIIHPKFNTSTFDNDVALLLMSSPVELGPNISPICLPKKIGDIEGKMAVVLGWGKRPEKRLTSGVLQELILPIMSNKECEQMYRSAGIEEHILESSFCAGIAEGGKDTCDGDSGGPMSLKDSDGKWSLIGLVSWGGVCGAPLQPGVFTRVQNYVEWIEGIITCYQY